MNIDWNYFWETHSLRIIVVAIVLVAAWVVARILRMLLHRLERRRAALGGSDPTHYRFLRNSVSATVFLVASGIVLYIIPGGKTLAVSLFAGAGIFAAIVGFASQQAFSNIVSGIFLVIFKPYRVGDVIEIGIDRRGVVEDITLRHTVIRNWENKRVIIPNSVISAETVTNSTITDTRICRLMDIGISYESDLPRAKEIMRETSEQHPLCIDARTPEDVQNGVPQVVVRTLGFSDSAVLLRGYAWADTPALGFAMASDLYEQIKARFDAEGIEIPYPHRTLVQKSSSTAEDRPASILPDQP